MIDKMKKSMLSTGSWRGSNKYSVVWVMSYVWLCCHQLEEMNQNNNFCDAALVSTISFTDRSKVLRGFPSLEATNKCQDNHHSEASCHSRDQVERIGRKEEGMPLHYDRRKMMTMMGSAVTASSIVGGNSDPAMASQSAGEAIRRTAANIPGYGQADVFYPPSFLGKWKATRTILAAAPEYLSSSSSSITFPITVTYEMRFIPVDGDPDFNNSKEVTKVVADRAFNEISYQTALSSIIADTNNSDSTTANTNNLLVANWNPSNPNVLTMQYSKNNSSSKEIKVTKRASEVSYADETVSSSEFRRITTVGSSSSAIPTISASRILNKWKSNGPSSLEGIELLYEDVSMAVTDPLAATNNKNASAGPRLLCKSRILLQK
jgi:hypothetical protein